MMTLSIMLMVLLTLILTMYSCHKIRRVHLKTFEILRHTQT